jgi:hypothetical protein
MKEWLELREALTYSNVVSTLCLFLLLGGGAAYAAGHLGKNSVGTKQLKRNSVTTAKIRNGAVTGQKVATNTLTGTDIDVSTLGTVPYAARAVNSDNADAVGSQRLGSFSVSFGVIGAHEVLSFGGLTLIAECPGGNVGLSASNVSGQPAALQAGWIKENGVAVSAQAGNFSSGSSEYISSIPGSGSGTVSVSFADGSVTTLIYAYQNATQTGFGCHVFGRAVAG